MALSQRQRDRRDIAAAQQKLQETQRAFQRAIATGAVSQGQAYKRHIMEYSRRIQALERRNEELRDKIHDLQPTEEPASPVDLCQLPDCCEPVTHDSHDRGFAFCKIHQHNYDSWSRDATPS